MRVVLLKGSSLYGALRSFVDEVAAEFARRGFEPQIVDLEASASPVAALTEAARREAPTALVYSICIAGEFRDGSGRSLSDMFGAPHVLQHVDHPLTHHDRLSRVPPSTAVLTVDPSHVTAIKSVYGEDRFAYVGFCPHSPAGEAAPPDPDADAFAARRDVGIFFPGTLYKPEPDPWAGVAPLLRQILDAALEIALGQEWIAPLDALDLALAALGLDPAMPEVAQVRIGASMVNEEIRRRRRWDLLRAAAKLGVPIHVRGSGYERHLYRFKNITFGGQGSLAETQDVIARSRVVLSVNANFGRGSHDRPLMALLRGAAPASDHSVFWAEHFEEDVDMVLYRWKSLDAGLQKIATLAADPEAAHAMVRSGQPKVLVRHGWDHQVAGILAAAEAARPKLDLAA